ncbi:MAG: hypothetical protein IJU95_08970 [Treponema sp.]|nr:hypothetical protein [Treponema sp.]
MSTASIRKPMIISSDESAKILADILEAPSKNPPVTKVFRVQTDDNRKNLLQFLKLAK